MPVPSEPVTVAQREAYWEEHRRRHAHWWQTVRTLWHHYALFRVFRKRPPGTWWGIGWFLLYAAALLLALLIPIATAVAYLWTSWHDPQADRGPLWLQLLAVLGAAAAGVLLLEKIRRLKRTTPFEKRRRFYVTALLKEVQAQEVISPSRIRESSRCLDDVCRCVE